MRQLRYIWKTSLLKIFNSKFGTFFFLIFCVSMSYMRPMTNFVADVQYPVSWCVFPFLIGSNVFLTVFWLGIVYIHSDIPFLQYHNMYQIIRTGRTRWVLGHMAGICIRSFAAVLLSVMCSILPILTHIEWTNEWGKVLKTLATGDYVTSYSFPYLVYYDIMKRYTPLQLLCLTVLILALVSTFLGIVMWVFSLYVNRTCAVAIDVLMCLMLFLVLNTVVQYRRSLAWFIPTFWAKIAQSATPSMGYYMFPPVWYMLLMPVVASILGGVLVLVKVKRMEFHWVNEDC
ncbi:MAG: hypothetical protein SO016_07175 [Lachnospiraceae bacterium]|nr:hypothetical protein [Lachnospiraceae bacterium]